MITRDEHSRDGIDERGLAGAGIAGDQETLAGHGKIVVAVQRTPVDDLNARETALTGMDHGVSSCENAPKLHFDESDLFGIEQLPQTPGRPPCGRRSTSS